VAEDWAGIMVKAATPPVVIARLNEAINRALKTDKVREALANLGVDTGGGTPEAFGALVRSETEHWT
jgi:tripartite-type tricarboxylate transporter receptor subunit TctC